METDTHTHTQTHRTTTVTLAAHARRGLIIFEFTAKIEGLLLLLCGYLSFIVGNLLVIIQLYRSSTMNSQCIYMTASQSYMLSNDSDMKLK